MTEYLSAEAILGADDLEAEDVAVPEWGGTVRVRGLSGTERDKLEARYSGDKPRDNFRAALAAAALVDADDKRMFRSEAEVKRLGDRSSAALERVCNVAMRLSGLSDDDVAELEGN